MKKNVRNRIKIELNRNVINFLLPFVSVGQKNILILTFLICHVLGRGTFAVVEKCKYKNNIVAVKKLHFNLPQNFTNIFTEEVLLLRRIILKNVVKIFGVCENPISIMTKHLQFLLYYLAKILK